MPNHGADSQRIAHKAWGMQWQDCTWREECAISGSGTERTTLVPPEVLFPSSLRRDVHRVFFGRQDNHETN